MTYYSLIHRIFGPKIIFEEYKKQKGKIIKSIIKSVLTLALSDKIII